MRKLIFSLVVSLFALPLVGCGSAELPVEGTVEKPLPTRLGDSIDLSLAELLTKPRKQLAEMADEVATRIQIQEKGRREGRLPFTLIPTLRLPLAVPVLRTAHYSAKAEFSLPPYLAEDSKDSALALHLARYGDYEAAEKLVEPGDSSTSQRIQEARFQKLYPVEWTRLASLLLHSAQLRLATGDVEGGTELVVLHRQLRAVLDPQAAKGTLGAVLLSQGRQTLTRAVAAWREDKKSELAAQADAILADWGEVPVLTVPVRLGTPRAQVTRLLRSVGEGRVVPALCTARAFDLFALPFPDDGAEAVVVSFDDADRLANVLITYRPGFAEQFSEPARLAFLIEEHRVKGEDGPKAAGLLSRKYPLAVGQAFEPDGSASQTGKPDESVECTVSVVVHGAGVGAFVRFGGTKDMPARAKLERDFGGANLDRSFEQNRVRLAPEQRGETALTIETKALAQLRNPLPALQLAQAELHREAEQDVASALVLRSAANASGSPLLHQLAMPFWLTFGLGQFQAVSDKHGGHLALTWEDAQTRYTLRLPYDIQPVELEISDRQGTEKLAERKRAADALDRLEREKRMSAGKPLVRVGRYLEELELGMKRNQVLQLLPPGQGVLKQTMPGGITLIFRSEPARTDVYTIRQMFISFDNADRVVELRARYMDGPAAAKDGRWMTDLVKKIVQRAGAPREAPPSWAKLWADLPVQKPAPLMYRWQDDITLVVYQRDAAGVEIAVRDVGQASNWQPLEYLPHGPANVQLGDSRPQVLQRWGVNQPVIAGDGALVLRPPQGSRFDAILVWFDNDQQVVRIVARHAPKGATRANPAQAVADAWSRELAILGWPRRQDLAANDVVQGLGWHDDRTRVRIFWQETDGPPRVFTEWRELVP